MECVYSMELIPRVSLIVYLKHIKHERQIRKYGHIIYTNKQRKYVVLYVNENDGCYCSYINETKIRCGYRRITL